MLSVPDGRRVRTPSSSRAPTHLQSPKRANGRLSMLLILTGLLLVVAPMLTADASACTTGGPQCSGATSGGQGTSTSRDSTPASADHAAAASEARNGGNHGSHVRTDSATGHSALRSHHGRSASHHSPTHAQRKAAGAQPDATGRGVRATGARRVKPPVAGVRDQSADREREASDAVVPFRSPRVGRTDGLEVAGAVEQVAGALRFPASLLGVILLFLALQQHADRRDPKLANAPIVARQETLEFR